MNGSGTVTRGARFALVVAAVFAGAGWIALLRLRPAAPDAGGELEALTAELGQLHGNEDGVRDGLRGQQAALNRHAWSADAVTGLRAQLGPGWRWAWASRERVLLSREQPRLEEWLAHVALVAALGQQPGLVVESVEVRAEGAARSRRFVAVTIGLRFNLAAAPAGDAERAAPNRVPPPVAPADGPAPTRKVGPVAPLRRPDAFAEPPAPGPVSASFRPDPPGSSAGIQPNQNPQEKSP